jgi:hypothetical protein
MSQGIITTEHTVWCFTCAEWVQCCEPTKRMTEKWAKEGGWRKVNGKWHCPKCVEKLLRSTAVPAA